MAHAELPVELLDTAAFLMNQVFYLHISLHCTEKIAKEGRLGQERRASELIKEMQS